MNRCLCAQVEMNIMRINFEATEVGLARARTPVGLRTAVLSDIAELMEGTALGCGDRASKLRRLLLTWHKGQHTSCCLQQKTKKKLFSDHKGSLPRRQPGALLPPASLISARRACSQVLLTLKHINPYQNVLLWPGPACWCCIPSCGQTPSCSF